MITTRTVMVDAGYAEAVAGLMALDGMSTEVGLPENGETSGRYTLPELIAIANLNEFGSDDQKHPPERSFIRSTTDENREKVFAQAEVGVSQVMMGQASPLGVVHELGDSLSLAIKAKISSGDFKALAPRTIEKKGHDMPLVETGQLFESIQHKERNMNQGA